MVKDLTGMTFGRLKVIERAGSNNRREATWLCECQCAERNKIIAVGSLLLAGKVKSCGCLNRELSSQRAVKRNTKHGLSATKLYQIWNGMRQRTSNSKRKDYKNYGGRGIRICEEWLDFENFKDWALNNEYKENLTIERIDVNGNYCPNNCKWIPFAEQASNKQSTVLINYKGKDYTLKQIAEATNNKISTIKDRYYRGWSIEEIFNNKRSK